MPIVPDTKNWTWVLERPCPDCGFDTQAFERERLGQMIRDNAAIWRALLSGGDDVTRRPSDDQWSALEYACHVRDVFRIFGERIRLMLEEDNPDYPNWDQDRTAIEDGYVEQDPSTVSADLIANAEQIASQFDAVTGEQWARTGTRSDGAHFTVESLGRYLIHDPMHHLYDVGAD